MHFDNDAKETRPCSQLTGVGVHTGCDCEVRFSRVLSGKKSDLIMAGFSEPVGVKNLYQSKVSAEFSTVLTWGTKKMWMPEHLIGILVGFSNHSFHVEVSGREIPLLDGSGLPWLKLIAQVLGEEAEGEGLKNQVAFDTYSTELQQSYAVNKGYFEVSPAPHFSVEYSVDLGTVSHHYLFDMGKEGCHEAFLNDIAPARTFTTWADYNFCLENNLLKGVSLDSGWLIAQSYSDFEKGTQLFKETGEYPWINPLEFRTENELAKHKILDLIGDLALYRLALPKLKIKVKNAGHFQNHQLLKDLIHEQSLRQ